ncbi:endonuclease [Clostridium sp. MCC334]|nr:endonuclease [Clostridium sp. MCC334]
MYTTISTKNMDRNEWLKIRKTGLGGSDAGAVCGLNPYVSPMAVYRDKVSDETDMGDNEAMRQGRDLEEYVAQRFTEETGLKVRRSNKMYRSTEYPWMIADVDRMVAGGGAGLECKTVSVYKKDQWADGGIPVYYLLQCYHYMIVTGCRTWYLAAVILGQDFQYRRIEYEEETAQNLIALEAEFWNNHVLPRHMPDPDGSKSCDAVLEEYFCQRGKAETIELVGFDQKLERRQEIEETMKLLETEKRQIDQEIKVFMDGHEMADSGRYRVTWREVISSRLDTKRLKEEKPDIYREFLQESKSSRFTVKVA